LYAKEQTELLYDLIEKMNFFLKNERLFFEKNTSQIHTSLKLPFSEKEDENEGENNHEKESHRFSSRLHHSDGKIDESLSSDSNNELNCDDIHNIGPSAKQTPQKLPQNNENYTNLSPKMSSKISPKDVQNINSPSHDEVSSEFQRNSIHNLYISYSVPLTETQSH
jgi:hypothetical protein